MLKNIKLVAFLLFVVFFSCKDSINYEDLDKREIPDKNVSFGQHIFPVINAKCTYSGCHNDETRAGGYSVTTWSNVMLPGVVNPGDTTTSRILWRINSGDMNFMMPPYGYPPLTLNQRRGVATWIKEGALNN